MSQQDKVNLFVLGAAKCGTTSLHTYLNQHPSILMAYPKEPLYFEAEFERGDEYYIRRYFPNRQEQKILGDARHRNLFLPFVVPRISSYAPEDAKFLIILRNPVDRAYSHWWHDFVWGDETRSFQEAIDANYRRLENGPYFVTEDEAELYRNTLNFRTGYSPYVSYIDSGFYAEQIMRVMKAFGKERIKILLAEDLKENPEAEMESILKFVGVSCTEAIDFRIQNEAFSPAGAKLFRALKGIPGRSLLPKPIRSSAYRWIRRHFRRSPREAEFSEVVRDRLINTFDSQVRDLEDIIDRDLSSWRAQWAIDKT